MIQRYKSSLPAPLALLVSIVVCQLCTAIQWYLGDYISFQVNKTMALVPLVANDLALVATLVLSDRIAIQLLLITPRQRSLLLLLQALLLVPLTTFFTLSWSIWALPALLISLYLQMLCYSRPDRLQRLTLTATKGGSLVAKVGDKELTSGDNVVEGTTITIEATPETGYELTALTAGTEDILATKSFEMKGATEVKATFTKLQKNYVVTLQSNEHGTISIQEKVDLKAVPEGTKLTVVAKGANDKCELTKLTANGKDILKDMTFTVTEDVTVVAEFVDHTGLEAATTATLSVYPNPAKEYAIVSGLAPESMVALYTLEGQLITRLHADRSGSLQIDLTALSDGTYLVVTEGAAQRLVVKH